MSHSFNKCKNPKVALSNNPEYIGTVITIAIFRRCYFSQEFMLCDVKPFIGGRWVAVNGYWANWYESTQLEAEDNHYLNNLLQDHLNVSDKNVRKN